MLNLNNIYNFFIIIRHFISREIINGLKLISLKKFRWEAVHQLPFYPWIGGHFQSRLVEKQAHAGVPARLDYMLAGGENPAYPNYRTPSWLGFARAGQVLLELGVVLSIVALVLVAMRLYVQRSLQARYKDAADRAVSQIHQARLNRPDAGISLPQDLVLQYEPYYEASDMVAESDSEIRQNYSADGRSSKEIVRERNIGTGIQRELPYSDEVE